MRIAGPAAGHALLQAKEFTVTDIASTPTGGTSNGLACYGTVNNCAHGITPWGTYLTCEENFNGNFGANDAEVLAKILIKTRMAADAMGATMMDRPEWTGARPQIGGFDEVEVYCTLTNNNRRSTTPTATQPAANAADGSTGAGSARPPVDVANPREDNVYGHIIRWRETGKSVAATTFAWDLFAQAGDTDTTKAAKPTNNYQGNIVDVPNGSADYGAPDGLWFDHFGRLWVQTDQVGDGSGDWLHIGSNVMVCCDPNTGETRRFLTSPNKCEVTGVTLTPDGKSMWVGIQHPGEEISKNDGGVIGS